MVGCKRTLVKDQLGVVAGPDGGMKEVSLERLPGGSHRNSSESEKRRFDFTDERQQLDELPQIA